MHKLSPGSLFSNEVDRFQIKFPQAPASALLAVGIGTCWDIAAIRRSSELMVVDPSRDVIRFHQEFFKPLFLAAESRGAWVGHLTGDLDLSFEKNLAALCDSDFEPNPIQLSEFFSQVVRQGRELAQSGLLTDSEVYGQDFLASIGRFYLKKEIARHCQTFALLVNPKKFSMLGTEESYQHVRNLYVQGRVGFYQADIFSGSWIAPMQSDFSEIQLSDLYFSNLGEFGADSSLQDKLLADLATSKLLGGPHFIYTSHGKSIPFEYQVERRD